MVNALPRTHLRLVSALLAAAFMVGCGSARTDAEFAALYVADDGGDAPTTTTGPQSEDDGLGQATGVPEATGESTVGPVQPRPSVNTGAAAASATVETEGDADPAVGPVPDDGSTASDTAGAEPVTEGQDGDGGTPPAPPSNGEPIRVATIGTLGGPIGSAIAGGVRGAQAWAAAVNAAGGVDGHPIELFAADDGGDPARYRSLLAEMVENRGVVAIVHTAAALSGQAGVPYVEERGIPVIGSEGGSPWFNTSPMHFPQQPSDDFTGRSFANMIASAAGEAGLNRIAILYCAEIGGCNTSTKAEYFEEAGLDVVYRTSATLAAPDYTAQCLNARNAGAEILLVGLDAQSVQRIVSSCGSVGYAPQYAAVSQAVNSSLASVAELDGMWAPQTTAPWFTTDIPAVAEFVRAVQQFAPGQQLGGSLMQGWVSGKLLEAAIRASDDPTTSEGIRQGLYRLQDEDLGGLTYPITFEEGAPNNAASLRACWWDVRLGGGEFVSPNNGRRTCP